MKIGLEEHELCFIIFCGASVCDTLDEVVD